MAIATLPPGGASGGTMDGHAALGEEGDEQEAAQMQGEYVALAKEDVKEVPETWVRPINRQNPKPKDYLQTRRMIDDYIRMGWNDDRIMSFVQNTNMEFLMDIGLSEESIDGVRQLQNQELSGVPPHARPAYRAAVVKCIGSNIIPWETGNVKIGNNQLSLERMHMTEIPAEIYAPAVCREVRSLSFAGNALRRIEEGIVNFHEISILKLTSNKLEYISPAIGQLTRLKVLWLNQNLLRQLPIEIGLLTKLDGLALDNNRLEFLPYTVGRLVNLKDFRFDKNPHLKSPPPEVAKLGNKVVMSYLQTLDQGDSSGKLKLRNLKLKDFPVEILHPANLACLGVHYSTLVSLDLTGNGIKEVEDAPVVLDVPQRISHRLSQLTYLSLASNPLARLPHFVCALTQLETLSLERTLYVTALPVEMGNLTNLTDLRLTVRSKTNTTGAMMISPPPEIIRAATKRAKIDGVTGKIVRVGTAGIAVQYLRMIDDAKRSKRLYLSGMGINDFPPEVLMILNNHVTPPRDRVGQQVFEDKMHRTYTEPLEDLLQMEYLLLSRNSLSRLPPSISGFEALRALTVDYNRLTELPMEITKLTNLEELSATNNRLSQLPAQIGKCCLLVRVNVQQNVMEALPESIGACTRLQTLLVADNALQELPASLGKCARLQILNIADNQITKIPPAILDLTTLKILLADGNQIKTIPENLGNCLGLGQICLARNLLESLPFSMGVLTRLGVLRLEDNPGMVFPPVEVVGLGVAKLRAFLNRFISSDTSNRMLLSYMRLSEFPMRMCDSTFLSFIDLSHNELKSVPDVLASFPRLEVLQLQHNRLRAVPESVGQLSRLNTLHVNNNNLRDLPDSLANLDTLTDLALQCNRIRYLPLCIGALVNLKLFSASDNPLVEPPAEVINGLDSSKMTYNYNRAIFDSATSGILILLSYSLRKIPKAVFEFATMETIMMGQNEVAQLPGSISLLTNLRVLSLPDNQIESLPPEIAALKLLQDLNLSNNRVRSLGQELLALGNLRNLRLDGNDIALLPDRMQMLSNLVSLVLFDNPLARIPASLCHVTTLTELRFEETQVRRIPMSLGTLSRLRALSMDASQMEEPRAEICLGGLQVVMGYLFRFLAAFETKGIDLSGFGILQFPSEIFSFRSIDEKLTLGLMINSLDLSSNALSLLPETFADLRALTDLSLADNALLRVPGAVCWLTQLTRLDLRGNFHLRRLPLELANLRVLREFHVTADRFLTPPPEILSKAKANDTMNGLLGVVEYMKLLVDARDSGILGLRRMGLRQFPPEVIAACCVYWEYGEVRGTFITGRGQLDALKEVHLENNNMQLLPASVGQLIRCRLLDVSTNLMRILPPSIANLTSLTTLNVSKNRLILLNPILARMTSLTKLALHHNDLKEIPEIISTLQGLQELSVSNNRLTELPHSIPRMTNLKNLLAAGNRLRTDPSAWGLPGVSHELGFMPNLIELNLEQNDKLMVPPLDLVKGSSAHILRFLRDVFEARETRTLALRDMDLREIPQVVLRMDMVHTLSLSDNTLRSVPVDIKQLTSLTYLELDNNQLVLLPEDATKMSNLTELRCSNNQIKRLPETCNRWIRVQRIIAQDNKIKAIPEGVCEMPHLTELDLENNKLVTLPEAFIICTSLTRLRFDTTDMVKASPAVALPDGIRRCEIPAEIAICGVDEVIRHFFKMHQAWSTHRLDLHGFGLRTLMLDVCQLSVLTELNLSGNRLKYLPSEMTQLKCLKKINLDNCYKLEYFHHDMWILTNLKKLSIKAGLLDSWHHPTILMKWPPTVLARQPLLERQYLKELSDCVGKRYKKDGRQVWESTHRLDYRFVPHEVSLDPITSAEIDSEAKRSFPDFPPEIWHHDLTTLQVLHLPGGHITSERLGEAAAQLTEMRKLILIDQKIDYLPEELALMTSLEVLCFTGNQIKEIPSFIFKMISLTKLILIENQIAKLPAEIGLLTNLTDLVLTYNKLIYLPDEIGNLPKLDYLVMDENKIVQIPDTIQNLTSLKEMSFNDNKISRFPVSLGALTQLEVLEFGKNPSILLPPKQVLLCEVSVVIDFMQRIWDCKNTQKLNFRNFQLKESTLKEIIKEIWNICTDLDISKNLLTKDLPASLKNMTGLTRLNISENTFATLNLETQIEAAAPPKKVVKIRANVTLRTFFEDNEMVDLYDIMTNEFDIKRMADLRKWVKDEANLKMLPLDEIEKIRLVDALQESGKGKEEEEEEDHFEEASASGDSEADAEAHAAGEGVVADPLEEVMDEEEAQRLLDDQRGGKILKFDMDTFKGLARSSQVAFYSAIIAAKAKLVERYRRKQQKQQDTKSRMKANGFRAKLNRQEGGGLQKKKKKKIRPNAGGGNTGFQSEEELNMKKAIAQKKKADLLAAEQAKESGEAEKVVLNVEAGGGLVKVNIYSVAIFTCLTELAARKNSIEYLPEDLGNLRDLTALDISNNEVRWLPPSMTDLRALNLLDVRNNRLLELPEGIGGCTGLATLRADHNALYDLPESICACKLLTRVTLDHCEFQVIPAWINQIQSIDRLSLAHNKIKKLPPMWGPFSQNLVELRLNYNMLSNIPQQFTWMTRLKILDLSGNAVVAIPKSFGACQALEELHVDFCSLEHMDVHLAQCSRLVNFTFDGNEEMKYPPREVQMKGAQLVLKYFRQIIDCPRTNIMLLDNFDLEDFDDKILEFRSVTWLNLSNNAITKVPSEIRQLLFVELVNMNNNKLGCVPRIFNLMDTVTDMSFDNNAVEGIEPGIVLLSNLTRLSLSSNIITRIHPSVFKLTKLEILDLNDNKIGKLPGLVGELRKLVSLALGSNKIEQIPPEIGRLTMLRQLVLFGNRISELPHAMEKLVSLEVLTISQNRIERFPATLARALTNLRELWLTHNQLRVLPSDMGHMTTLEELWIQDNLLELIPEELGHLTKLKVLAMTGNKIHEIPRHVKTLKIATNAERDKGEEFWQDFELDAFSMAEDSAGDTDVSLATTARPFAGDSSVMSLSGNPTIVSSTLGSGNIAAMSVLSASGALDASARSATIPLEDSGTIGANATQMSEATTAGNLTAELGEEGAAPAGRVSKNRKKAS